MHVPTISKYSLPGPQRTSRSKSFTLARSNGGILPVRKVIGIWTARSFVLTVIRSSFQPKYPRKRFGNCSRKFRGPTGYSISSSGGLETPTGSSYLRTKSSFPDGSDQNVTRLQGQILTQNSLATVNFVTPDCSITGKEVRISSKSVLPQEHVGAAFCVSIIHLNLGDSA